MLAFARHDLWFTLERNRDFGAPRMPFISRAVSVQLCLRSVLSMVMIKKCRGKEASDSEKEMD